MIAAAQKLVTGGRLSSQQSSAENTSGSAVEAWVGVHDTKRRRATEQASMGGVDEDFEEGAEDGYLNGQVLRRDSGLLDDTWADDAWPPQKAAQSAQKAQAGQK